MRRCKILTFLTLICTLIALNPISPTYASIQTELEAVPTDSPVNPTQWTHLAAVAVTSPVTIPGTPEKKPLNRQSLPPSRSESTPKGKKIAPPPPKIVKTQIKPKLTYNPCSCVSYAQAKAGVKIRVGYAKNTPINSKKPQKGAILVTKENSRALAKKGIYTGHNAYVEDFTEKTITVSEANYSPCKVTTRVIKIDSPVILGYHVSNIVTP